MGLGISSFRKSIINPHLSNKLQLLDAVTFFDKP